jgi:hypothetical protein
VAIKATKKNAKPEKLEDEKRSRISQTDVPAYSLEHALRVPTALAESYASEPAAPLRVAMALNSQPGSGPFRMLCGAAIAYGLTEGGYNAPEIKLTPLGRRVTRPLEEGGDLIAKREALLKPRVIGEFLRKYNGSPIPKDNIAQNVLADMGVPVDRTTDVLALIIEGAESLGLVQEIKGKKYVDLGATAAAPVAREHADSAEEDGEQEQKPERREPPRLVAVTPMATLGAQALDDSRKKKVFITHGKDKSFVEPIRKLLQFGEMEAMISVERQSVSQPVPDKVMNDMRACGAAIIHVDAEQRLLDQEAKEHVVLNPNVLIEIGAAMALYGRRFILLVRDGVKLPSNLQGLYEVRYTGEVLDGSATIRLLEAINELKKIGPVTSVT